jgi:tRNA pseudouridine38-40 synthase
MSQTDQSQLLGASTVRSSSVHRLALLLEYDGSAFLGSQLQSSGRTVQGTLEQAWSSFTGDRVRAHFAGRTDTGVHARGQVATIDTETARDSTIIRSALNHFLPDDFAVRAATEVAAGFDARRHAYSRVYQYVIEDGRTRSPLSRNRAWQRRRQLDAAAMTAAASRLPFEERDWAAFGGPMVPDYPTVRLLHRSDLRRVTPHRLEYTIAASGFLPHQVRRTVGALVQVGDGALTPDQFADLIDGPPSSVGPTAPPQGLTLLQVHYPPGTIDWSAGGAGDGTEEI